MAGKKEGDVSIEVTYIISQVVPAPQGSVILHFGIEKGEPFASTMPCTSIAVMAAHITTPVPNMFDKIGAMLDWQKLRPLAITDSYVDAEMSENSMMVTPQTRMWEIVDKVSGWKDCHGDMHAPTIELIKLELSRVGILPQ